MKNQVITLLTVGASLGVSVFTANAQAAPKPPKNKTHHLTFAQADVDASGGLTVLEFGTTQGKGTPLVEIRRRFLPADTSGAFEIVIDPDTGLQAVDPVTGELVFGDAIPDGLLSLEEFQAYKALEEKPKSELSRFALADFDGDGQLSPVEFGYLVSPSVPVKNVMRKFGKLDTSDDGFLSKEEFRKPDVTDL